MSGGLAPVKRRPSNNSGIKFALGQGGGGAQRPDSATSRTFSEKSGISGNRGLREKASEEMSQRGRHSSHSYVSSGYPSQHDMVQARSARTPVRTIPAWVRSAEEDDLETAPPSGYFLPNSPQSAFLAQHNHSPWPKARPSGEHDEDLQDGDGLLSGHPYQERKSRWISFTTANAYPKEHCQGEKVNPEWLNEHFTDYSKPWLADHNEDDVEEGSGRYHAFRRKQKTWYKRMQQTLLRNPMIPLVFRMTVFTFSAVALGLGGSIHHQTGLYNFPQSPSALMAIIVDAVALVYILYITYDEYTGKPLGLRAAKAKLRIILLDLVFIVFQSANLSLAFQTLSDPSDACTPSNTYNALATNAGICSKQKALASVVLIALVAWLSTFCVSILRLVERVVQR